MTNEKSDIEKKALALPDMVKVIVVKDKETLERAGKAKVYCKTVRKGINDMINPRIKLANDSHKGLVAMRTELLKPVLESETYINGQIASYMAMIAQQRREAEQKERNRQLALERAEEEKKERIKAVVETEPIGNREATEKIEQIMAEPEPDEAIAPLEPPPPDIPKMDKVHMREHWEFEIIDRWKIPSTFLMPDLKAIGENVRMNKGDTKIPGVRVFRNDIVV